MDSNVIFLKKIWIIVSCNSIENIFFFYCMVLLGLVGSAEVFQGLLQGPVQIRHESDPPASVEL